MKKFMFVWVATLTTGIAALAQEKAATPTPAAKNTFAQQFPGASKVKWEKEGEDFEVNFKQGSAEMSAVIDAAGHLKETETEIAISALPANVQDYVKQHYKGSNIKEAAKITKADGKVNFEAEVNKQDLLFDEAGGFISAGKD